MQMHSLMLDILRDVLLLSIDYSSFRSIKSSVEVLRSVCRQWREEINALLSKISNIFGVNIRDPIVYRQTNDIVHHWRNSQWTDHIWW